MEGGARMALATMVFLVGCQQHPFGTPGASLFPSAAPTATASTSNPQLAQLREWEERARKLDADNADLHRQLAQSQQQLQLTRDELRVLRRQLEDTAAQLESVYTAKQEAERRLENLVAANRVRTGATITANNSLTQPLRLIDIPGLEVRRDGDVLRVEIPADQLFEPGTVRWQVGAARILDLAGNVIQTNYPRQILAIEAHTDNSTLREGATLHQLAASQALAVFQHLTQRGGFPERQLFTVAHGPNQPLVSNGTPAGRARNRRIELVIYPETF